MSRRLVKPERIWLCPGLAQDQGCACYLPLLTHWKLHGIPAPGCCGSVPQGHDEREQLVPCRDSLQVIQEDAAVAQGG